MVNDTSLSSHPSAEVDSATIETLRSFAIKVVPFFSHLSPNDILVSSIKGGTTNQLYKLTNLTLPAAQQQSSATVPSDDDTDMYPAVVVVRVYGKDTDKIISRDEELFWQSQFLETYGSDDKMLAYEFLDGFRPLTAGEFYPRRLQIARRMAAFHAKATLASVYRMPTGASMLVDVSDGNNITPSIENQTLVMLKQWVALVSDIEKVRALVSPAKQALFDKMGWADGGLIRERDWLLSVIARNIRRLPTAICHNDFTCGNFMINEHEGEEELRFIDFEYTRLNFTYFDLGNHFCEYGGLECDFTKFPDKEVISEFIREYLESGRKRSVISGYVGQESSDGNIPETNPTSSSAPNQRRKARVEENTFNFAASPPAVEAVSGPLLDALLSSSSATPLSLLNPSATTDGGAASPPSSSAHHRHRHNTAHHKQQQKLQHDRLIAVSDAEVAIATDLVRFFALVSHFGWAIWGVIQENVSEIDFGFMDYAWARWDEYMKRKDEFSKNVI